MVTSCPKDSLLGYPVHPVFVVFGMASPRLVGLGFKAVPVKSLVHVSFLQLRAVQGLVGLENR